MSASPAVRGFRGEAWLSRAIGHSTPIPTAVSMNIDCIEGRNIPVSDMPMNRTPKTVRIAAMSR
ncbi:MAG: hypothetical protein EA376_04690 [Phycisphaeraceae bacterium]|nr:MAG: hypothetical protein EA376_04690 [Phycisphaeraceae bacterium]